MSEQHVKTKIAPSSSISPEFESMMKRLQEAQASYATVLHETWSALLAQHNAAAQDILRMQQEALSKVQSANSCAK